MTAQPPLLSCAVSVTGFSRTLSGVLESLAQRASAASIHFCASFLSRKYFSNFPAACAARNFSSHSFSARWSASVWSPRRASEYSWLISHASGPKSGLAVGERLQFLQARLAVLEQGERGLVGDGPRLEFVAKIAHRFDGAGFAFRRFQHGGITQPRIERFEIRGKIFGVFLARGGEVAAELVDARIVIMLLRSFRAGNEPARRGERFETLRDFLQRAPILRHLADIPVTLSSLPWPRTSQITRTAMKPSSAATAQAHRFAPRRS